MSADTQVRNYRREEFSLLALLLLFFSGIMLFSLGLPFDAKLFPLVIGTAGILLALAIGFQELRRRRSTAAEETEHADDPAVHVGWARFATALLSAPVFGLVFWLLGFFVAALAAMLLMPPLMGYANRGLTLIVGLATVAVLAVFFPYLVGVDLPYGMVGDLIIDRWRPH